MFRPGNGISNEAGTCYVSELKVTMMTVVDCVIVGSNFGLFSYEPVLGSDGGMLGKL